VFRLLAHVVPSSDDKTRQVKAVNTDLVFIPGTFGSLAASC
jgi:hypothetical protein